MPRTVLQLVNAAQAELGLSQSSTVFGTTNDLTAVQMGALANRVLDEMRRMHDWSACQFEYNLIVEEPLETTGNMAAGSAVITAIPTTAAISAGSFAVSGDGIPQAARVLSVDSATQVTMTMQNTNTAAASGTDLIFARDTYPIPSDFDWFQNQTMWDRTNFWRLLGPDSPQADQRIRSGIFPLGPRRHWRQLGRNTTAGTSSVFRLWPPPTEITAPLQLVFEYLSINTVNVTGAGTSFAQRFTADTDTCLLDEDAIIQGIKWMFWEIKGFGSYVTLQQRWIDYVDRLAARDGGAPVLNMARRDDPLLISPANVRDGNFPSEPS